MPSSPRSTPIQHTEQHTDAAHCGSERHTCTRRPGGDCRPIFRLTFDCPENRVDADPAYCAWRLHAAVPPRAGERRAARARDLSMSDIQQPSRSTPCTRVAAARSVRVGADAFRVRVRRDHRRAPRGLLARLVEIRARRRAGGGGRQRDRRRHRQDADRDRAGRSVARRGLPTRRGVARLRRAREDADAGHARVDCAGRRRRAVADRAPHRRAGVGLSRSRGRRAGAVRRASRRRRDRERRRLAALPPRARCRTGRVRPPARRQRLSAAGRPVARAAVAPPRRDADQRSLRAHPARRGRTRSRYSSPPPTRGIWTIPRCAVRSRSSAATGCWPRPASARRSAFSRRCAPLV